MEQPGLIERVTRWTPILVGLLPMLALIGSGTWALGKYLDERAENEQRAQRTRLIEVQKPFLDQQTKLYFETAKVIGDLMTLDRFSEQTNDWPTQEKRFWALYYSDLAVVEHCEVDIAMASFGHALAQYTKKKKEDNQDKTELGRLAIGVAHALRTGMVQSWSGQIMKACSETVRDPIKG
jgi:hypothetical protein